ncbi:hypothetical protein ACNHKD_07595 [Methylocystis sp. JAN1]|uniref:hypothetical protein n=1 Tax=Methylocystis sp. JAN1 TaxID=3397211 RepID=UPI003FA26011
MSHFSIFADATRKVVASYLRSRTMRDIVAAYLIVLGALIVSICDAEARAPETVVPPLRGGAISAAQDGVAGPAGNGGYGSGATSSAR